MGSLFGVIVFVFCFAAFLVVWRKDSRNSIIFTPFLIFMANEFSSVMPGFVYTPISGEVADSYPLFVFFVSFVTLILGFLFGMECIKYKSSMPLEYQRSRVKAASEVEIFFAIACGSAVLLVAGLYLYQGVPSVPQALIGIATGEDIGEMQKFVGESRRLITKGHYFGGQYRGQGIVRSLLHVGWPFLSCLALVLYFNTKKAFWFVMLSLLLILSFVFVAGEGSRGPFLNQVLLMIVMYSYIKKIRFRNVFVIVLVFIASAILLGIYSPKSGALLRGEDTLLSVFGRIWERILLGNSLSDIRAIEFIRSSVLNYRLGELHLGDMMAALPGSQGGLPFAHELYLLMNPGAKGTTFATGTYITKAFVDFGIVGVGFGFFALGFFGALCQSFILRIRRTPVGLTMAAFLAFYTGRLYLNGPVGMAIAMVFVLSFYLFIRILIVLSGVFRVSCIQRKGARFQEAQYRTL